mmetsp:Transcript_9989/g.11622  ORF Transcript_9989/g.11622 Transcript_9989/m.11622 type:complete len:257 (-) Transcript_9989:235-1005(-)|eukprot:CAMPEP_0197848762 /NCGR_PEP_ID=MMETSP1438-20131217/9934_1 /TAXON_ID=1461541 /ORGANISM="Pterosperma sp., Strain CCMP1384" /LENGTH=256 /DNA_ID=CAMNT_0043461159 /DNA_START=109 /DNA_END=879 /DNA_ORIENTATION=+
MIGNMRSLRNLGSAAVALRPAGGVAATLHRIFPRAFSTWTEKADNADVYCRQRTTMPLGLAVPTVARDAYVAPSAVIVGDVDVFDRVSVGYSCVLRGDLNNVSIDAYSTIGDKTVVHAARTSPTGMDAGTYVGIFSTIGSNCVLRSCTVKRHSVVGNNCILMEGSVVESKSVLEDGTVLPPGRFIPSGQLWGGNPATYVRDLSEDEVANIEQLARSHEEDYKEHKAQFLPYSNAYIEADELKEKFGYVKEEIAYPE